MIKIQSTHSGKRTEKGVREIGLKSKTELQLELEGTKEKKIKSNNFYNKIAIRLFFRSHIYDNDPC